MYTNVHFSRREVIVVTVTVYEVFPDTPDENIVQTAIDAYQTENSQRKFEAEIHFVMDKGPKVERLQDCTARVTMMLSKALPTD